MNTTKMHYLCIEVGPTMECGDPSRSYLDVAKEREGKTKMYTNVGFTLESMKST